MNAHSKRKYFFTTFVVPFILALIAVASTLLFQYRTASLTREQTYQSLSGSAMEQTATLREIFNGRFDMLDAFANSLANQESELDFQDIIARMNAITQVSDFEHLAMAGLDGIAYASDGQIENSSDRFYMTEALAGRQAVQKLTDSRLYQKNRIVLSVPLRKNGEVVGAVMGSFPNLNLEQLLVSSAFGGNAYSLICDSAGYVIVSAENPMAQYEQDNVLIELSSDMVDFFSDTSLETIADNLQNGSGGLAAYAIRGEKRYVVYQPTGINDWFIFNVVPSEVVDRTIRAQTQFGMICIGAVAVCAVLLLVIMALQEKRCIRELSEAQEKQLVYYCTDSVTGLSNMPGFIHEVEEALDFLPADRFCAMLDFGILNFNQYNVSFGSPAGDAVLRRAAQTLLAHCRIKQPCARLSGDRFACFIFDCVDMQELLERIAALDEKLHAPEGTRQLQMTYGVYIIDDRTLPAETLCDRAVAARLELTGMERKIGIYNHSVHQKQIEDAQLVECMEESLRRGEFTPYYQPKYNACTQRIVGAEALVRWLRPDGTVIPPDRFIQLFEQTGMIIKLDLYMFESVCKKLASMDEPSPVAVNFSRAHMYDASFPDKLMELANKHGVAPRLLEIELTETAFIDQRDALMRNLIRLRELGFVVSIDDFGSGYSSLNLLKDVRVDVIKLDKEFLADKAEIGRSRIVIESILTLARALHVHTVAEGVETQEQLDFLRESGCDTIQGYYFSRPVPEAEFDRLLREQHTAEREDRQ